MNSSSRIIVLISALVSNLASGEICFEENDMALTKEEKEQPFETAFKEVIAYEGGYVNDPRDPGGETKFGISKKAYPKLDIKGLTPEKAKEIYRRDYWDPLKLEDLNAEAALFVFDTAVNQGLGTAQLMKKACLDPVTKEFNIDKFIAMRLAKYRILCAQNPKLKVFRRNWYTRVARLENKIGAD